MESIWIVQLEVIAYIDSAPTEEKLGFINVVASAGSAADAQSKAIQMVKGYDWAVFGVAKTEVANPKSDYGDDLNELIDDVIANPTHIRLSTLHSYKTN